MKAELKAGVMAIILIILFLFAETTVTVAASLPARPKIWRGECDGF
jgi:hypothetical protein